MARLSFSAGTLLLEGMSRTAVGRGLAGIPWVWDPRVGVWRADAAEYRRVAAQIAGRVEVEDVVPAWRPVRWPKIALPQLRPEQQEAVSCWTKAERGCVVMPTGTGKTEVALTIMAQTAASTLVVAPVRDLMYQWHRRILAGLGYDAGIVGDNIFRVRSVSVTTYDSACIHMERFGNRFQLLIFDECHHLPGAVRRDAARMSAAPWRLGLTATPHRSDGREVDLDELIGPIVYEMPMAAAKGRVLSEYEVVRIPVHLSPSEQARYNELSRQVRQAMFERRRADPHFTWEDLCADTSSPEARRVLKAFRLKQAIEDRAEEKFRVLEDLLRLHAGERTIVFAGSNAMARDICRRFLVPCLLSHCGKKERLEVLQGLEQGVYPALVANRVLDEGVDLPEAKVAIVVGGMASTRQAKQRLGRILRKSGNARAVLYEIVTADTGEVERSRARRQSDAYQGTRHRKM